ncbi:Beta-1,2-xylosyltransferase 1 [Vanrija pseudolonga]|uniref:Beta-1,2-xylosyltransferase 1 n=1 Tax=Vanrija pseudolonga TaxID=143232 RepID=A0AAF0Y2T5_9TREE|nr:Beta-1,2-xylosyltransferase 1 [Vanrija pseudolonga]
MGDFAEMVRRIIPLPKRSLRSIIALVLFILTPIILIHRLASGVGASGTRHALSLPEIVLSLQRRINSQPIPGTGAHQWRKKTQNVFHADTSNSDEDDRPAKKPSKAPMPPTKSDHKYLRNGLLVPNPHAQHPIYDLITRSNQAWETKLERASKTLDQAVKEYRRRYGRNPPRGFDKWWAWAQKHNIKLPDEYDQIHEDLEPYWAISPAELRKLRTEASELEGTYTITCRASRSKAGRHACKYTLNEKGLDKDPGHRGNMVMRADARLGLVTEVEELLEDVDAVFYSHDVPWQFVGHDFKESLRESASLGEYFDFSQQLDQAHLGWASACAPHHPLRKDYKSDKLPDLEGMWHGAKSFVWDHKATMDPCQHPTLVHLNGFLAAHGKGPGPSKKMYPIIAMCKTMLHSDVLAVAEENWMEDVGVDPEWDEKKHDSLLWRGKTTGILFREDNPWNISQRMNLLNITARDNGTLPVLKLTSRGEAVGHPVQKDLSKLNDQLMDVAFVDTPIQCEPKALCDQISKEYKFGDRMTWVAANEFKYQLDIDGNGWSARFKRLMTTNSAIVKSTIFPEWYSDRIQPWVHYIPVKADLTDLYDVMSFFHDGHDDLAKKIASAGKQWSTTFYRRDDMISYEFRLLLELARLTAPDREKASYVHKMAKAKA